jgi:hypothetical protein
MWYYLRCGQWDVKQKWNEQVKVTRKLQFGGVEARREVKLMMERNEEVRG